MIVTPLSGLPFQQQIRTTLLGTNYAKMSFRNKSRRASEIDWRSKIVCNASGTDNIELIFVRYLLASNSNAVHICWYSGKSFRGATYPYSQLYSPIPRSTDAMVVKLTFTYRSNFSK